MARGAIVVLIVVSLVGCETECQRQAAIAESERLGEAKRQREADEAWEGRCLNHATLVATTAGSPSEQQCWNKHHRMRVEAATKSGEEIGAVIFCECVEPDAGVP